MCSYFSTSNPISRYIEDLRSLGCSYEASPTGGGGGGIAGALGMVSLGFSRACAVSSICEGKDCKHKLNHAIERKKFPFLFSINHMLILRLAILQICREELDTTFCSTLQAICTAVSLLACVPLGELFFFHIILIRKVGGMKLVYIVASRPHSFLLCKIKLCLLRSDRVSQPMSSW